MARKLTVTTTPVRPIRSGGAADGSSMPCPTRLKHVRLELGDPCSGARA